MNALHARLLARPAVQIVLDFLYEIWQWAIDGGYDPEDLAISLENFVSFRLAPKLVLDLEQAGLIKRKVKSRPDEPGRPKRAAFEEPGLTIQEHDCIWLSELGSSTWAEEIEKKHYNTGRRRKARKVVVPLWWPKTKQLCLWEREVRHFKQLSANVEAVLEEYRKSGCAPIVKSPFRNRGTKRGHALRSALYGINADQDNPRVILKADKGAATFRREVILRQ
jgi:hypothetical protein